MSAPATSVIKIDYNIPDNPPWVRLILDEIVETSPQHFQGKIHVRVLPGVFVAVGYFRLEQPLNQ